MATRRLAIEKLEQRALLAGTVSVSVNHAGSLLVNGDSADNAVEIAYVSGNQWTVSGTGGTTINGGTTPVTLAVRNDMH